MWWLVSATYDAWEVLFYQQMESAERWNAVETAEG